MKSLLSQSDTLVNICMDQHYFYCHLQFFIISHIKLLLQSLMCSRCEGSHHPTFCLVGAIPGPAIPGSAHVPATATVHVPAGGASAAGLLLRAETVH